MQTVTPRLLQDLAACGAPLCVSLYMEMAAGGGEHDHIRIALKNARSEAAAAIASGRYDSAARSAVEARLEALDYADVAGGHDRRVAVFIAPDRTHVVDARFAETGVHVGTRFRLAPLVADLQHTPDHAVLVVTSARASLYRADADALTEEHVRDMPAALTDITRFTDQQEKGNIHGREDSGIPASYQGGAAGQAGPSGVSHHSMGGHDWHEDQEQDLRSYANSVINAVQQHLGGTNLPLVLAADERLYGMLQASCDYPFLVKQGISQHPDSLNHDSLRRLAADCLGETVENDRAEAWDGVAMSLGRGDNKGSDDPLDIVAAAAAGRVATLFVQAGATLAGHFDTQSLSAQAADDGPEDLIDRAIVETLRNGGTVFPLDTRSDARVAAAYRYAA